MRTLLINPKMPYAFWTMETTVELSGAKTLAPPLGLLTVAGLLPENWPLRLVDLNTQDDVPEADWQWADLVMIGAMLIQRNGCLELIQEAKKRGKIVIVGGPYTTNRPQELLEAGADIVFQGEAENQLPAIMQALAAKTSGVILKPPKRPTMALSPVPRFDLIKLYDYVVMGIQTSRGCPYNCEFCDVIKLFGRKPRYKKPEQVLAELEKLFHLGWRGPVFISDDNFIGNKTHATAILDKLIPWMKEHDEPFYFWTQTSVNLGKDLELIDLLTSANFSTVFIGVESTEEEVLVKSGKHHNKTSEMQQWIHNINANGLEAVASFIIGFDGEKQGADKRICQIVEACNLPWVMLNLLTPLPGTDLWDRLEKAGRLKPLTFPKELTTFALYFIPERPEAEILAEYRKTVERLYQPENYLKRACNYILNMRPTRSHLAAHKNRATSQVKSKKAIDLKMELRQLRGAAMLFWRQGIKAPFRNQFWRQLWHIWQRNPSRLRKYLRICAMGENGFFLRKEVEKIH